MNSNVTGQGAAAAADDDDVKKKHCNFRNKQRFLSIDMKTKLVYYVLDRVNERVKECESERVTFEHRHENKSCSACQECTAA